MNGARTPVLAWGDRAAAEIMARSDTDKKALAGIIIGTIMSVIGGAEVAILPQVIPTGHALGWAIAFGVAFIVLAVILTWRVLS